MDYFVCLVLPVTFSAVVYHMFLKKYIAGGVCNSKARMDNRTVIITGANTGIGKETALDLAKRGARVIMACRDLKKGEAALKDVAERSGSTKLVLKQLDLASLKSVHKFAKQINTNEPELHVLINNAGVGGFSKLQKTEDGFEMMMGVNHLGHFLLTNLLVDLLKKSAPARVVIVSSVAHRFSVKEFGFDNINSEFHYNKHEAYSMSKVANILFARELARRLQGAGVTANSLHPGNIWTEFPRNLNKMETFLSYVLITMFGKTREQGAQTTIHLAVSEEVEGASGLYFSDCKPQEPSKVAQDDGAAKKLWEISASLVGLNSTV